MVTGDLIKALSFSQVVRLVEKVGHLRPILIRGEMGVGKSSVLSALFKGNPDYLKVYADCTTMSEGDIAFPYVENGVSDFAPNRMFGIGGDKKPVIMFDEIGKAKQPVIRSTMRTMLERKLYHHDLPEGNVIFGTTNLVEEGLGDFLQAHQNNRLVEVTMRKPTSEEWIAWGVDNGVSPVILAAVEQFPAMLETFHNVPKPDDNPYIFHPKESRKHFVTPRSLAAASDIVKELGKKDDTPILTSALAGTVGPRAAVDIVALNGLSFQLPTFEEVVADPLGVPIPDDAGQALCLMIFSAVTAVTKKTYPAFAQFLNRLGGEQQALFYTSLMRTSKRSEFSHFPDLLKWGKVNKDILV